MPFDPAYEIPLSEREYALLGQLVAVLGQAEEEMILSVSGLIHADRLATERIMGAGSMAVKSSIWVSLVKLRSNDDDIHKWVEHADGEIGAISEARNDYVHANWRMNIGSADRPTYFRRSTRGAGQEESGLIAHLAKIQGIPTAARTQKIAKTKPATELEQTVDRARRLTQVVAHITHRMSEDCRDGPSPWRDRLGGQPPPRSERAAEHKAKEPKRPHIPLPR